MSKRRLTDAELQALPTGKCPKDCTYDCCNPGNCPDASCSNLMVDCSNKTDCPNSPPNAIGTSCPPIDDDTSVCSKPNFWQSLLRSAQHIENLIDDGSPALRGDEYWDVVQKLETCIYIQTADYSSRPLDLLRVAASSSRYGVDSVCQLAWRTHVPAYDMQRRLINFEGTLGFDFYGCDVGLTPLEDLTHQICPTLLEQSFVWSTRRQHIE